MVSLWRLSFPADPTTLPSPAHLLRFWPLFTWAARQHLVDFSLMVWTAASNKLEAACGIMMWVAWAAEASFLQRLSLILLETDERPLFCTKVENLPVLTWGLFWTGDPNCTALGSLLIRLCWVTVDICTLLQFYLKHAVQWSITFAELLCVIWQS